jgi:hypothetical protein
MVDGMLASEFIVDKWSSPLWVDGKLVVTSIQEIWSEIGSNRVMYGYEPKFEVVGNIYENKGLLC